MSRQEELLQLINGHKDDVAPVALDQTSVGRLSRMDAMQGQAMAEEVKRRRENEILRIKSAFERMEEDEYGYCLTCGNDIAQKRLELDPSVALCNKCAV
ncbi:MAG: hypothetical protein P8I94_02960 [Emcibacteraceae bacterium]|nr:hypothetical protein [Emcibacteraceae bacterium]